mmetsp:Transcript_11336/g.26284  ORF Transcript_11336/g.26284 Transcript_11336/m.26284 type:complete len:92 (-) Transcript_11336:2062-2337(-)
MIRRTSAGPLCVVGSFVWTGVVISFGTAREDPLDLDKDNGTGQRLEEGSGHLSVTGVCIVAKVSLKHITIIEFTVIILFVTGCKISREPTQ